MDARSWWFVVAAVAVVAGIWWFVRRGAGALTTGGAIAPPADGPAAPYVDERGAPPAVVTTPTRVYAPTVRGTAAGPAATPAATYLPTGSVRGAQPDTPNTYVKPGWGQAAFLTSLGGARP